MGAKTVSLGLSLAVILGTAWLAESRTRDAGILKTEEDGVVQCGASDAFSAPDEELDEILPVGVTQQLERSTTPEHGEQITGFLRGEFAPNQTKISLFAGFCPPLTRIPSVECFVVEGDAQLEVTQVLPHGFSVSVKKRQRVPFGDFVLLQFTALEFGKEAQEDV